MIMSLVVVTLLHAGSTLWKAVAHCLVSVLTCRNVAEDREQRPRTHFYAKLALLMFIKFGMENRRKGCCSAAY